jgi:hypothetical protein
MGAFVLPGFGKLAKQKMKAPTGFDDRLIFDLAKLNSALFS